MKTKKVKVLFTEKKQCPHCKKMIEVRKTKKLVTPAVPAKYEEVVIVDKSSQATIQQATKEAPKKTEIKVKK